MQDMFGNQLDSTSKFSLFHDESYCEKSNFLYHGYLFVKNVTGRNILDELKIIKKNYNREFREIHFNELHCHSLSSYGSKTKIAIEWLTNSKNYLVSDNIKFYCLGVNKNNVNDFWINESSFDENLYLRFFEIGLKSAIKWFNLTKITHTFLDDGKYDHKKIIRINKVNLELIKAKLANEIDVNNINVLSSDENKSHNEFSNFFN